MKTILKALFLLVGFAGNSHGQDIRTITYPNGDVYVGEFREGQPNGQGTHNFANGDVYVGEWRDGQRTGQGTYTFGCGDYEGDVYVGEWRDGQRTGQGNYRKPDGSDYLGEFRDSNFYEGTGSYTFANGDVYVIEYREGQPNGQATLNFANGDVYVGEWRDGQRTGQGTYSYPNGTFYVGEFRDGQLTGQGTVNFANGDVYVGEWRDGQRTGQGTYIHADGIVENGVWLKDAFVVANNIPPVTDSAPVARATPARPDSSELLQAASGSAFSVSFDGYLVTNNHVIEGCENVRVHSEGRVIDAAVISRDPGNDLAVIKANFRPAAVFALRDGNPQLMQEIYVAGFPFGENLSSSVKVTKGIVSSLTGLGNNFSNIQIDAAIQPGNSGGPIFDGNGNVLGVAVSSLDIKFALENFDAIPQNTNFGIKANIVSNLLSSNGIDIAQPNTSTITIAQLGALATDATFYLSCWMTTAQIQEMSSTKVLFNQLRN